MLRRVIQAGETFENPRTGTRIEIVESSPERVIFDRRYPSGTGRADAHVHFDVFQSWEVLFGEGRVVIDGDPREASAGDLIEIPTGMPHQDIHNPFDEGELVVRWTVSPVNEFVEAFADCYTHYLTRDRLNRQDEFTALQLFPILRATRAQSWLTRLPIWLQKPLIPIGAWLGRLRGYRPRYDDAG
jgi:mannose-6-phosphate isomerase-like protein (cupin superfamily)